MAPWRPKKKARCQEEGAGPRRITQVTERRAHAPLSDPTCSDHQTPWVTPRLRPCFSGFSFLTLPPTVKQWVPLRPIPGPGVTRALAELWVAPAPDLPIPVAGVAGDAVVQAPVGQCLLFIEDKLLQLHLHFGAGHGTWHGREHRAVT